MSKNIFVKPPPPHPPTRHQEVKKINSMIFTSMQHMWCINTEMTKRKSTQRCLSRAEQHYILSVFSTVVSFNVVQIKLQDPLQAFNSLLEFKTREINFVLFLVPPIKLNFLF